MNTVSANEVTKAIELPNAIYEPHQAAAWLLSRHDHAAHLVDRVGAWMDDGRHGTSQDNGGLWSRVPDLDMIAEGIEAADLYGVEWKAYEYSHPAPRLSGDSADAERAHERAYERWEQAGPETDNPFALSYLPMSSGEKRLFRMLAVLSPGYRIRFNLDDTCGVSLRCCTDDNHRPFVADWADLLGSGAR